MWEIPHQRRTPGARHIQNEKVNNRDYDINFRPSASNENRVEENKKLEVMVPVRTNKMEPEVVVDPLYDANFPALGSTAKDTVKTF